MSEEVTLDEAREDSLTRRHYAIIRMIILSGWVLSLGVSLMLITSSVYMMVMHPETNLPQTLREWATMALGYLVGSFPTMLAQFLKDKPTF